jgi:hypothetical protein
MGRLPNHLWRRAVELVYLAGRQGNDGSLPNIAEMSWALRIPEEKVIEDIRSLVEVGIVTVCTTDAAGTGETPEGWVVTNFKKRQYSESFERVKRYSNAESNAHVTKNESISNSSSSSESDSEEGGVGIETSTLPFWQELEKLVGRMEK